MIDRVSRDKLATALRQYVSGRITNDDLDGIVVDWRDSGAVAVKERAWCLYDDLHDHKAVGKYHLDRAARDEIARWIVFLHSNVEYTWPRYSFDQIINWPMKLLTLGWWEKNRERIFEQFKAAGDYSVWPFVTKEDFETALENPRYLVGSKENGELC